MKNSRDSVVTVGTFDGVHRGHRALIGQVIALARTRKLRSVIVTLERPVRPVSGLLTTLDEKIELLSGYPVDDIIVLPAHADILEQPAQAFLDDVLIGKLSARHLVVGNNFAFGKGRQGTVQWLRKKAPARRLTLDVVGPVLHNDTVISSTLIRELLHKGSLRLALSLLGGLYSFEGHHVRGRQIGRTLGFPTVNVRVEPDKLLPRGVYAALVPDGDNVWEAVVNIGTRPTFFSQGELSVEINLLGFRGEWTRQRMRVNLCKRLRGEKRFSDSEKLKLQIAKDVSTALQYFNQHSGR